MVVLGTSRIALGQPATLPGGAKDLLMVDSRPCANAMLRWHITTQMNRCMYACIHAYLHEHYILHSKGNTNYGAKQGSGLLSRHSSSNFAIHHRNNVDT